MLKIRCLIVTLLVLQFFISVAQPSFTLPTTTCMNSTITVVAQNTTGVTNYSWSVLPLGNVLTTATTNTTAIVFTTGGTATVQLSTSSGIVTQTISVGASMSFSASMSSATTCIQSNFPKYSKPIIITCYGASSCTWNPALPSPIAPPPNYSQTLAAVRPSVTTCYTITGFQGTCNETVTVCVPVVPQFSFDVLGNFEYCEPNPAVMAIANIQANSTAPYNFLWTENIQAIGSLDNNYTQTVAASPAQATTYTVEVKDANNCIGLPRFVNVTKTSCVSIEEKSAEPSVSFGIKTTNETLEIVCSADGQLLIVDVLGRGYYDAAHHLTTKISLTDFPTGLYIVNLQTQNTFSKKKFYLNK